MKKTYEIETSCDVDEYDIQEALIHSSNIDAASVCVREVDDQITMLEEAYVLIKRFRAIRSASGIDTKFESGWIERFESQLKK
jgi:hypothetical protein